MPADIQFWSCPNCETSNEVEQDSCMVCGTEQSFAIEEPEEILVVPAPRYLPVPVSDKLEWSVPGKVYQLQNERLTQRKQIKKNSINAKNALLAANWGAMLFFTSSLAWDTQIQVWVGVGIFFSVIGTVTHSYIQSGLTNFSKSRMNSIKDPKQLRSQMQRFQGGHDSEVKDLKFFAGSETLLSSDSSGFVYSWDIPTGNLMAEIQPYKAGVDKVAVSMFHAFTLKGQLLTRHKLTGKANWNVLLSPPLNQESPLCFSSGQGSVLGIGYANGKIQLIRVSSKKSMYFQMPAPTSVTALCIQEETKQFISGNDQGQVQVYDYSKKKCLFNVRLIDSYITSVSISFGSNFIFAGIKKGKVMYWNYLNRNEVFELALPVIEKGEEIQPYPILLGQYRYSHLLLVADSEGYLSFWKVVQEGYELIHQLYTGIDSITSLDLSEHEEWIAVGGKGGEIAMFHISFIKDLNI